MYFSEKLLIILLKFLTYLINVTLKIFVPRDIDNHKNRKLKSSLIRLSNQIQKNIFDKIKFSLSVKFVPEKNYFLCAFPEPIMLRTDRTNKYYKAGYKSKTYNDGETFSTLLDKSKINNIIDIGSCFGEISIYLAKTFDKSKIISIEGSIKNFELQEFNIKENNISNIVLENAIVSNTNKNLFISNNRGSENYISEKYDDQLSSIKSYKLQDILVNHKIVKVDFLKIDIEGSIPFLTKDLIILNNEKRINNIMLAIEKNSYESYLEILDNFSRNLYIYDIDYLNKKFIPLKIEDLKEKLKKNLPKEYSQDNKWAVDILFSNSRNI